MTRFFDSPCRDGSLNHEDPDNSGLCIRCSALLTSNLEDVEDAVMDGQEVSDEVKRYAQSWETLMAKARAREQGAPPPASR